MTREKGEMPLKSPWEKKRKEAQSLRRTRPRKRKKKKAFGSTTNIKNYQEKTRTHKGGKGASGGKEGSKVHPPRQKD